MVVPSLFTPSPPAAKRWTLYLPGTRLYVCFPPREVQPVPSQLHPFLRRTHCGHHIYHDCQFPICMDTLTGGMSDTRCPPSFYVTTLCGRPINSFVLDLLSFPLSKASNVGRGLILLHLCIPYSLLYVLQVFCILAPHTSDADLPRLLIGMHAAPSCGWHKGSSNVLNWPSSLHCPLNPRHTGSCPALGWPVPAGRYPCQFPAPKHCLKASTRD